MKKLYYVLMTVCFVWALSIWGCQIRGNILNKYEYENKYSYAWELADKSSDLLEKCKYIDEFVYNLELGKFQGDFAKHDATRLQTKDNSFDYNLEAVKSLKRRLYEIKDMDVKSFEYNVAIQQITAQEQGEAHKMMNVFYGCYTLQNCWYIWDWYCGLLIAVGVVVAIAGLIFMFLGLNEY